MNEKSRIDCLKCENYYVTWDAHFPKGCKIFKVKTKLMPSQLVFEATGAPCEHFLEKKRSNPD